MRDPSTAGGYRYHSKAVRLAERMQRELADGRYGVGELLPTEQVLTGDYRVSRLTLRRAVQILAERGLLERQPHRGVLVVQRYADDAVLDQTDTHCCIAAVLAADPDPGMAEIQAGIQACARDEGLRFQLISDGAEDPFAVLAHVEDLDVDGVVLLPYPGDPRSDILEALRARHFPLVCVERRSCDLALPSVEPDNKTGMYLATTHLLTRYRQPVWFLGLTSDHKTDTDRYDGYVRAMKDAGHGAAIEDHSLFHALHTNDPAYWRLAEPWRPGYDLALRCFASGEPPYSIACLKDDLAVGVYRAAEEAGMRIGEHVLVTGFDDLPASAAMDPPLTTVRQPLRDKGYQAVRLLVQVMRRQLSAPLQITLPVELVIRRSA